MRAAYHHDLDEFLGGGFSLLNFALVVALSATALVVAGARLAWNEAEFERKMATLLAGFDRLKDPGR